TSKTWTIQHEPVMPEILGFTASPQDECNPSGSIVIEDWHVSSGDVTDFTFIWFRGSTDSDTLRDVNGIVITASAIDSTNYKAMGAGTYYVKAFTTSGVGIGCYSTPLVKIVVKDEIPAFAVEAYTYNPQTACNGYNGEISVIVNNELDFNNYDSRYDIRWYLGDVQDADLPDSDTLVTGHILSNVADGIYTVQIENLITGCEIFKVFTIEEDIQAPIITTSKVDNNTCVEIDGQPIFNGQVFATITNKPGTYVFEWYPGKLSTRPTSAPLDPDTLNNLAPGDYTVFATEIGGDQCNDSRG